MATRSLDEIKKALYEGKPITYDEAFTMQESLGQTGESVAAKIGETFQPGGWFKHGQTTPIWQDVNAENMGSILGQAEVFAANKKRKIEQKTKAQQGFGAAQSILGGSAF